MPCEKCNARCPFDGTPEFCPDCDKDLAVQLDPADAAMLRVREDAEVLRRHSAHHSEFVQAAIARAAVAQALLIERMTFAVEAMAAITAADREEA